MSFIIHHDETYNIRLTVRRILQLASDLDAQEALISMDGFIDNLIQYMKMEDDEIRLTAARSAEFLSRNPSIKPTLAKNDEIVKIMNSLYWSDNEQGKKIAEGFFNNIHKYLNSTSINSLGKGKYDMNIYDVERTEQKVYHFDIMGLNDPNLCNEVENIIIGIAGVVSIAFDKSNNRVDIVVKEIKGESLYPILKNAIAKTLNEFMAEIPSLADHDPDYVDDLFDEQEDDNQAISTYGFSSIESKLKSKQMEIEKKEKKEQNRSWLFNKLSQVISNFW